MSVLPPDYDSDPHRWRSWESPRDVHEMVAPELEGPVLDVGCGEGRLASLLADGVRWVGIDSSPTQLRANRFSPLVRGDMATLPFRDGAFAELTHLWCLYHVKNPVDALREAKRVLRPGGRYYACTAARNNDPEIMPEGYPGTSFDAEEAEALVAEVFDGVAAYRWDRSFFPLSSRDEVRAYCHHNYIPPERAEQAEIPLWLTKRGVLVSARKPWSDGDASSNDGLETGKLLEQR